MNTLSRDTRVLNLLFFACWAFNGASLQSILQGGQTFSATDPVLGSAVLMVLWIALKGKKVTPKTHNIICSLGGHLLIASAIQPEHKLNFLNGPDQWIGGDDEWLPLGLKKLNLTLLSLKMKRSPNVVAPKEEGGTIRYIVDANALTGVVSRWNLVHHHMKKQVTYPDR